MASLRISTLLILLAVVANPAWAETPGPTSSCGNFLRFLEQDESEFAKAAHSALGDLYGIAWAPPQLTTEQSKNWNQSMLELVARFPVPESSSRKTKLSVTELHALYDAVDANPVSNLSSVRRYDPDGNMGFCFGRAMTAHLEAIAQGVDQGAILKVWAVGRLRSGFGEWKYHVATLVRGETDWYAIDPIMGQPLKLSSWYLEMQGFDPDGTMRLFISEPSRFGVTWGKYSRRMLNSSTYRSYFKDLLEYFKSERFKPKE